jgi:hypothetical protein
MAPRWSAPCSTTAARISGDGVSPGGGMLVDAEGEGLVGVQPLLDGPDVGPLRAARAHRGA